MAHSIAVNRDWKYAYVEPKGGSTKSTGKPLLHAELRIESPNHP